MRIAIAMREPGRPIKVHPVAIGRKVEVVLLVVTDPKVLVAQVVLAARVAIDHKAVVLQVADPRTMVLDGVVPVPVDRHMAVEAAGRLSVVVAEGRVAAVDLLAEDPVPGDLVVLRRLL
jgi:hypothetical protein